MAIVARKVRNKTIYWIAFYTNERNPKGKRVQVWERVGAERREAQQLDRKRKKEVDDGTYARPIAPTMRFGEWLRHWSANRKNRNAKSDRSLVERFLLTRAWLCELRVDEVRVQHTHRLIDELKQTVSPVTGGKITEKYASNTYALFRTACKEARNCELMFHDPCVLQKGMLRMRSRRGVRVNYELADVMAMSACARDDAMVFAMLALLTGMREGEVCGRRWRDWDEHSMPLGCLHVRTQYDGKPLKTEGAEGNEHPRTVPVLPALARLLTWWRQSGFELTYCRKPTPDDFIVPRMDGSCHSRHSAYKLWRKACAATGVTNRSLHSTRHTFITLCRRAGARADVLERVTHNAAGAMIDNYTHFDWAPLCDAVLCLQMALDSDLDRAPKTLELARAATPGAGGHGVRALSLPAASDGSSETDGADAEPPKRPSFFSGAATHCASQDAPTDAYTWLADAVIGALAVVHGPGCPLPTSEVAS
jgi:integrase